VNTVTQFLAQPAVQQTIRIAMICVVALIAYRTVKIGTRNLTRLAQLETDARLRTQREQRAKTLADIVNSVVRIVIIAFVLVIVFSEFGVNVTPIIAGASIAGVALGFGAQSLVKDFFSGMFIVIENQFGIGDTVTVATLTGTVERMSLRTTVLRDYVGNLYIIPNGKIETVMVHPREWVRTFVDVTVSYDEDVTRVLEIVEAECAAYTEESPERFIEAPNVLGVDEFGALGARVRVVLKTLPDDSAVAARALRRRFKAAFDRERIQFAHSSTTLSPPIATRPGD
jgi:moderate conductance mechanosensitive channel